MKTVAILIPLVLTIGLVQAFPPAPHHEIYGTVRDEQGNPLSSGATVTLSGTSGPIISGPVHSSIEPGIHYSLKVPMDAGTLDGLYQSRAMSPTMPFTATVTVGNVEYVPIEVVGGSFQMGDPGGRTRLDLTLGIDRDGDGLPDAWEEEVIAALDHLHGLDDVTPEGDVDGDGVSNYIEYLAGTYAFDQRAVFRIEILNVTNGQAHLRFLAVKGRSYRIFAGPAGDQLTQVAFSLQSDGAEELSVHRATSIRFQDIYVPEDVLGGKQLFRLHVD